MIYKGNGNPAFTLVLSTVIGSSIPSHIFIPALPFTVSSYISFLMISTHVESRWFELRSAFWSGSLCKRHQASALRYTGKKFVPWTFFESSPKTKCWGLEILGLTVTSNFSSSSGLFTAICKTLGRFEFFLCAPQACLV